LLKQAFREAAKLSPEEQDAIASMLLAELDSERRWDERFAESQDALARLAKQAVDDENAGRTEELVPDDL